MDSLSSFFEMGGYAVFIWPSYLVTAFVLATLFVTTLRFLRSNEAELKDLQGEGRPSARPNAAEPASAEVVELSARGGGRTSLAGTSARGDGTAARQPDKEKC